MGHCYLTLSISARDNTVKQSWYLNGEPWQEGILSRSYYDDFLEYSSDLKFIEFGRAVSGICGNWVYLIGDCECARLYNTRYQSWGSKKEL